MSQLTSDLNPASDYLGDVMALSMRNSLALKKTAYRHEERSSVAVQSRSREISKGCLVMEVPDLFKMVKPIKIGIKTFVLSYFFLL